MKNRILAAILILLGLGLISLIASFFIGIFVLAGSGAQVGTGNVAHIKVIGPIMPYSSGGLFSDELADSSEIVEEIEKASEDPEIKAILFEIDSPGGAAVASAEIASAIEKANKTTVAWIRDTGASGAYWVASSTDHIVANPMSITGSIGVIASYLQYSGLMARYNVTYQRLVSGEYKDMGSPFRNITGEEEAILQEVLDQMRDYFVQEVARNRNISIEQVEELADGRFYTGIQAEKLGLVDELGGKEQAIRFIEKTEDIDAELVEYAPEGSFFEALSRLSSEHGVSVGRGIGEKITETRSGAGIYT